MKVTIAKHSGFCYGVKRAVDIGLSDYNKKTYTFGQLIHNGEFQKKMDEKGINVVESLDSIKNCNLIIRSHGVGKKIYDLAKEKNINIIDATCPYVKKIHEIVRNEYKKNRKVIIIGNPEHPEVKGILGWCEEKGFTIKNAKKAKLLLRNIEKSDKISVVCQTTFKVDEYEKIKKIFESYFKNVNFYDTICAATRKRQESAVELSKKVDLMIVVGGKNSSNTKKLYELCKEHTKTLFIQNKNDYVLSDLSDVNSIGIVGGASTPDWVINNILQIINEGEGF